MKRQPITERMKIDALLDMYGIYCIECDGLICPGQPIQWDHRHALVHGGPHDYRNIRPVHVECHKKKTARDIKANAKVKRLRGETCNAPSKPIQSRGFSKRFRKRLNGVVVTR